MPANPRMKVTIKLKGLSHGILYILRLRRWYLLYVQAPMVLKISEYGSFVTIFKRAYRNRHSYYVCVYSYISADRISAADHHQMITGFSVQFLSAYAKLHSFPSKECCRFFAGFCRLQGSI
jgi:hypothetical protein